MHRSNIYKYLLIQLCVLYLCHSLSGLDRCLLARELEIIKFNVDVTPEPGMPVAYSPARKIITPLYARGIVLLSDERPVVLCAVDTIGIGNEGYDTWRQKIAQAADTTADWVAVHSHTNMTLLELILQQGRSWKSTDLQENFMTTSLRWNAYKKSHPLFKKE